MLFGKSKSLGSYAIPTEDVKPVMDTNKLPNTKHYGIVTRWLLDRGFGFATADDLDYDVLVHYASFGGGNLVVGKYIHFELDPNVNGPKAKYAENVTGGAVNKLWMDGDGNVVDWSVSYPREFYRIKLLDKCDASKRLRWHQLETRFLTHARSDEEYQQMIANQLAEVKVESVVDLQEDAEEKARFRKSEPGNIYGRRNFGNNMPGRNNGERQRRDQRTTYRPARSHSRDRRRR